MVAAVAVSLGNLLALDALVRRSSRAVAGGELPALAGLIVQGKLLVTAGLLAGLGALIGPSPVIAGFTLVTVCFTLAVGGLAFASLVSPVMESV